MTSAMDAISEAMNIAIQNVVFALHENVVRQIEHGMPNEEIITE